MSPQDPVEVPPNHRILLVDDNEAIHEDFRKILTQSWRHETDFDDIEAAVLGNTLQKNTPPSFEIDSVTQGQEALVHLEASLARQQPYSLAFVDMRMPPGWNGLETIEKLWAIYPNLHVVICTAYSDHAWEEVIERLGQTGRLLVLKKPFDVVEVQQLARTLAEKWRLEQQEQRRHAQLKKTLENQNEELNKNQQLFQLITEHAGDLISLLDSNFDRIYCSPSFETLLGYNPHKLLHSAAFQEIHPEDKPEALQAATNTVKSGHSQVIESRIQHQDGTWKTIESRLSVARQSGQQTAQIVVVSRDITDRKHTEQENQRMEVQLRHAQKMESIGQLAAGIAHEINTPTQFIGDNLHFLNDSFADIQSLIEVQRTIVSAEANRAKPSAAIIRMKEAAEQTDIDFLTDEIPKALEQSLDGVHRVSRIVQAMKEFSHPGEDSKTPVDINKAIESTMIVCRNEWKYVAKLKTEFDPDLPPIHVIPGEFNQVILNLAVNAAHAIESKGAKATSELGEIRIATRKNGDEVEIRLSDTGTGIPSAAKDKVYDPFFTTKAVGKGTGQGLAIAHNVIVDKHQGQIQFETTEGEGTTFIIRLPLTPQKLASQDSR